MISLRASVLTGCCDRLRRARADAREAQWWRGAPKDFEACADLAEKAKSKEEKTLGARRMQRKVRRPTQGGRRLHLL